MTRVFACLGLLLACLLPLAPLPAGAQAQAQETPEPRIRVGISMERSSSIFSDQIASLRVFFRDIGRDRFTLHPLPPDELMQAIRNRQLDAAFLNPYQTAYAQYLDQRARPLVTFKASMPAGRVGGVGGVVLVRSGTTEIRELSDLRGRQVAIPHRLSFGGYAAPLYELHMADPALPDSLKISASGTHRDALEALLAGSADAAFIDTVVLEQLTDDGVVDRESVRVINAQDLPAYPAVTSTRLYPGWTLVGLPSLTAAQTDTMLAVLLDVRRRSIGGLHGDFSLAHSYEPVHRMLRELGLPPYHRTPALSWQDIWRNEPRTMLLWASITFVVFLLAGFLFIYARRIRALFQQEKLNARRERALRDMPTDVEPVDILPFVREQLDVVKGLTRSGFAGIYRVNAQTREIEAYAMAASALGADTAEPLDSEPLLPGGGWAECSESTCALTVNDYGGSRQQQPLPGACGPVERLLLSPVEAGSGALILGVANKSAAYDAQDLKTVELLSAQIWGTVRRSEAEAQLVARDREARASADLLQGIFDSFAGGIVVYSGAGGIQLINPMASEFFGIGARDAIGRRLTDYGWQFCDRDGQPMNQGSDPAARVMLQRTPISNLTVGVCRSDAQPSAWILVNVRPLLDSAGDIARIVVSFSDITSMRKAEAELEHQAYYDSLTGVPNRTLGIESLKLAMQQCQRRGRRVAVAYIDLDNFKEVNDSHGHEVGDMLLKVLAARMHVALREGDTLARIGGDEFVAVLCDLQRETDCLPVVERLLSLSTEPVTLDEKVLSPTASIGISFYPQGEVALDAEQLLRQADHAMYQAKTEGRNCFRLFDQASNQLLENKHQLVNDVRRGLTADEFCLHYQPKVDLVTGEIRGAEALIRWQHPERGLLAPARFLVPLENHSVLIDLGDWVIDQALRDLSSLPTSQRDLAVSVNISPPQLLVEGFAESIRERLAAYPAIEGRQLELEILETSALENTRDVAEVITRCAEFGVHFALDDFGSGYSSLVYLQALPIDTLKIDQTFVRNMTHESADLAILRAIVSLAQALDIRIVAEGAETEEHCRLLRALGCEVAQGYAFARPMPLAELVRWLDDWQPSRALAGGRVTAPAPAPAPAIGAD